MGAPVFAWRDAVARDAHTGAALNGMATVAAWRALGGGSSDADAAEVPSRRRAPRRGSARELRRRALVAGFPLAVAALNRAGVGPLRADISGGELRRAGLRGDGGGGRRGSVSATPTWCSATPTAPGRCEGDDEHEWRGPRRRAARQLRQLDLRGHLPRDERAREPLLAGRRVLVEAGDPAAAPPRLLRLLADRPPRGARAAPSAQP